MSDLTVDEFVELQEAFEFAPEQISDLKLLWVDVETTGLEDADVILEFGMCISDFEGDVDSRSVFSSVVRERNNHYNARLAGMNDIVMNMHEKSGLLIDLDATETMTLGAVQAKALAVIRDMGISEKTLFLAGSSVHFDGGKLARYMPKLADFLHYRQINVSTLKEMCKEFNPRIYEQLPEYARNVKAHRVLSDLADSLSEYQFYVDNFIWTQESE